MLNFRALHTSGFVLSKQLVRNALLRSYRRSARWYSINLGGPPGLPEEPSQPNPPNNPPPTRKFPELLYFPKFFRWLGMKVKLKYLQKVWDPEFHEGAFIYGSTQAICRISQIIHLDKPNELRTLLTDEAERKLRADMLGKLTPIQKKVILLTPADIKLLVPIKVQLLRDKENRKQCLVMLKSLSMKWYQDHQNLKLVLIVIDTEFTRHYTQDRKSDWFVSLFRIVQCALINGSAAPPQSQHPQKY